MCGIAGRINYTSGRAVDPALLTGMCDLIAHRGPDDEGCWIDEESRVGLAHRRLAIVDLSACGHQPMHSADGRWVLSERYAIRVWTAQVSGVEPRALEDHDELRWLGREDLGEVPWLPADLPIVEAVGRLLAS